MGSSVCGRRRDLITCASVASVIPLPLVCPDCAARMPETAAFCPGCGRQMPTTARAEAKTGPFSENLTAALAYLTFVPAILFLLLNPYNKNPFVRYHSVQCLLAWGAAILAAIVLKLVGLVLFLIPVVGPLLVVLTWVIAGLAALSLWLVLVVKAFQGERFQLPMLGQFAEHYAPVIQR